VPFRHSWFLRRGLLALSRNPELAASLRDEALRHVQQFGWGQVTNQLLDVIRDTIPPEAARGSTLRT